MKIFLVYFSLLLNFRMMKKLILILFCLLILNENYNPAICGVVSSKNTLLWSEEFDQIDTKPDINTWSMDIYYW